MTTPTPPAATRRTFLAAAVAGGASMTPGFGSLMDRAFAGAPAILKPLPAEWFVDHGSNAEMRWDSVLGREFLTSQARLFVRNHTATPTIDRATYRLRIFGSGLTRPRTESEAISLSFEQLRRLPRTRLTATHECTGNGRSFFGSQQGTPAAGTPWQLGSVGTVTWEGVRLREVLKRVGVRVEAVSIQATGLDANYVSGGVDYGPVRRPFPVSKVLDDALLAWGMNGQALLPDHGYPLRLVLPGWVGIASIKWLGTLEVSNTELTSPWNTKWYRMTGGSYPPDTPPLSVNPVRSAWELAWDAHVPGRKCVELTGRSWSGAARIAHVDVSTDGGREWHRARVAHPRSGWTRWSFSWERPSAGAHVLMARASDAVGRTQPLATPFNDGGYFFDAVVRHPVTVV